MSRDSEKLTFNEFCHKICDGLYDPKFPIEEQCTGYTKLKEMVTNNIKPASLEEIKRWETKPTCEELTSAPELKYLRFLHATLRPFIIENWPIIKEMSTLNKPGMLKRIKDNTY